MRTRRIGSLSLLLLVAVAVFAANKLKDRSVVVTATPVRDKPSYAGKILGEDKLEYTEQVQVLELPAGSSWAKVHSAAKKLEGWVHLSTLSNEGKLVQKPGGTTAKTSTAGYEVALAGRGFSKEIEVKYQEEKKVSYVWVERMVNDYSKPLEEIIDFLNQGGVNPPGGAP
jgi:hypothetical protein